MLQNSKRLFQIFFSRGPFMSNCNKTSKTDKTFILFNENDAIKQQAIINNKFQELSKIEQLLPIKVSPFYQKKIDAEVSTLHHTEGPLHRIGYPSKDKISIRVTGEVADFVDDRLNMIEALSESAIQKYDDRLLLLTTPNCTGHCQYCFRQDVLSCKHREAKAGLFSKLHELDTLLINSPQIREVILSGGDPMTLSFENLKDILSLLEKHGLSSIRMHTRALIYAPHLFEEKKLLLLQKARVRLVFHIVHPYEVCSVVKTTIAYIQSFGIRCYNQFPILRNINDHHRVLIKHLYQLDELGIRNLSVFIPDPIYYSGAFRMNLGRLFSLIDQFNWNSPSWINSTRFVLDTIIGKVRREDVKEYISGQYALFHRAGREIVYPDFPKELDIPGNLKVLLWKDEVDTNIY